mgnify:CR=1 FL=1
MDLIRYKLSQSKGILVESTTKELIVPTKIIVDLVPKCSHVIRTSKLGLYNTNINLLSPMYCGDLIVPHITWGYFINYALVFYMFDDILDVYAFPDSANVAHSIY